MKSLCIAGKNKLFRGRAATEDQLKEVTNVDQVRVKQLVLPVKKAVSLCLSSILNEYKDSTENIKPCFSEKKNTTLGFERPLSSLGIVVDMTILLFTDFTLSIFPKGLLCVHQDPQTGLCLSH